MGKGRLIMRVFRTYWRLWMVLTVALIAAVAEWGLHLPHVAVIVINVAGLALAALMFWDMVQTLRSGKFGVDLLAITAWWRPWSSVSTGRL